MTGQVRHDQPGDPHRYATWDAAYVLGSLSAAERREFETHLADCASCREAVAELSGVPALLSQLSREDVVAINEPGPAPRTPELVPSLLEAVRWRRRRTRLTWLASAAAAVVLGIGVLVGVNTYVGTQSQPVAVAAQPMAQVGTKMLTSTVSLSNEHWGTFINLQCFCLAPPDAHHDTLAMVVVGRDGSQTRLATWVAEPGHMATPAGSISTPMDQIASVRVVAADSGQVLLERSI
ncbi:anti-sigma factor [Mycobacterium sp. TY815]|uniref:anti-sigma factor family protein n=1 Tax=Mycobacterium sp. TY815 TaxID=3050581 RepID=UPI002742470F|nr:zf-HC2 domain-containing protein [Mycobacterium sp. TY815]MDP7703816.1 zf-HC2 domain-containing protein [Mycobacterium sp. TY815]